MEIPDSWATPRPGECLSVWKWSTRLEGLESQVRRANGISPATASRKRLNGAFCGVDICAVGREPSEQLPH